MRFSEPFSSYCAMRSISGKERCVIYAAREVAYATSLAAFFRCARDEHISRYMYLFVTDGTTHLKHISAI